MAITVKRNRVNFNEKKISIGIDMHKLSWRITALVDGEIVLAVTLSRPNYAAFKKILYQFTLIFDRLGAGSKFAYNEFSHLNGFWAVFAQNVVPTKCI